jgi:adenylate kinase family enzyme
MAQRILVLGTTGSGKTTLARHIAKNLHLPHVELDALYWDPNWHAKERDAFRTSVAEATRANGWVIDGNYTSKVEDLLWPRAELAIWLDYPLWLTLYQVCKRTLLRFFTKEELWPGCTETFRRQFFSRQSIFVYFIKSYLRRKKRFPPLMEKYPHVKVVHIRKRQELETLLYQNNLKNREFGKETP